LLQTKGIKGREAGQPILGQALSRKMREIFALISLPCKRFCRVPVLTISQNFLGKVVGGPKRKEIADTIVVPD
jgi:hypothetical protein